MKLEKFISNAQEELTAGRYLSAVALLNYQPLLEFVYDYTYADIDAISSKQTATAKSIIQISKAIYDINHLQMTSLKFKTIDDDIYDSFLEKYKAVTNEEPFQTTIPTGMRSASHDYPELVGTLDKAYTVYDMGTRISLEKYLTRIFKKFNLNHIDLLVMPKYDGSSMSTTFTVYDNPFNAYPGKSTSRGDFGEDKGVDMTEITRGREPIISNNARITRKNWLVGIQYEIMVTEGQRKLLSIISGTDYSTRRAASAAVIKRILNPNTSETDRKKLRECTSLVPVNIDEQTLFNTNTNWYDYMISVLPHMKYGDIDIKQEVVSGNLMEVLEKLQEIATRYSNERQSMNYSIDGIVISVIDEDMRRVLGRSNNKNQWQIALKFGALVQRTRISEYLTDPKTGEKIQTKGIISSHGKAGFIGHNITFDPIEFNGVCYNKAPVNNLTRFRDLDPHIGDEVLVSYNADVMGYIYKDNTCVPARNGKPVNYSKTCRFCHKPYHIKNDMLICNNPDCTGNHIGNIIDITNILKMDFFGEALAEDLVSIGITNGIQFLQMDKATLGKVLKDKTLDKCWNEFRTKVAAPVGYDKVIDLLRIPRLRSRSAKTLIDFLGMDEIFSNIKNKDIESFANTLKLVPGISTTAVVLAEALIKKEDELYAYIKLLNVQDVNIVYDKTVLVSGFRNNDMVSEICRKKNWNVVDSGKYDILIVTPERINGTKAIKAKNQNKTIYTLSDFIDTFK